MARREQNSMYPDANDEQFIVAERRVEQSRKRKGREEEDERRRSWFLKKRDNNVFGKDRFSRSCYCCSRASFAGLVLCEKILLRKPQKGQRTLRIYVSWHVSSPCLPLSRMVFLSLVGFFFSLHHLPYLSSMCCDARPGSWPRPANRHVPCDRDPKNFRKPAVVGNKHVIERQSDIDPR